MYASANPFDYFSDLSGSPLDGGYVYYGQPNQDPIQFPKAVYQDAALTIPAPQPLRVTNGNLSFNGKPVYLFTGEGSYSILVQDVNLRQVYFVPDFLLIGNSVPATLTALNAAIAGVKADLASTTDATKGDAMVGAKQPIANATGRTQHDKNLDFVSVKDFGAVLDGVTDDSAAFNNALASGRNVWVPFTTGGTKINSTVTIGTGQFLTFEDANMRVKSTISTCVFRLTGYGDFFNTTSGIRGGCTIDMNGAPAGSTAIRFGTGTGVVWGIRLQGRFVFYNCYEAIGDEASASNYVTDVRIDDVFCRYTNGRQIYSRRSRGFFVFNDIYIDQSANPAGTPIIWEGARFEDFIGIELNRFDVATGGLGAPSYQATAIGLVLNGTGQPGQNPSVWIKRLLIDNTYGNGLLVNNVLNLRIDDCQTYQNLGYGMQFASVTQSQITKLSCVGGLGVTGASAGQIGIQFTSCDQVAIACIESILNTSSGVFLNNCTRFLVTNFLTRNNSNIGWVEQGTSNINIKVCGASYSNTVHDLTQVGASSNTSKWVSSVAFRESDTGAINV